MKNNTQDILLEVGVKLINVELMSFCINDVPLSKSKIKKNIELNQNDFVFEIRITQMANHEQNIIAVQPEIIIFDAKKKIAFANLTTRCFFKFEDVKRFIQNDHFELPEEYRNKVNSITLSTTRGIMFSEFKATHLSKAILPLIDVTLFKTEKV